MRDSMLIFAGAAIAVVLQLVLAPAVSIMGIMPNFVLVFVGVAAMLHPSDGMMVAGFLSGMVYDLVASGTPGVMAALLTLVAFCSSRSAMRFGSDTVSVSLLICMLCSLLVEVLYALFHVALNGIVLGDALLMHALPCALYDCAACLIVVPVLSAILGRKTMSFRTRPEVSTIRLR